MAINTLTVGSIKITPIYEVDAGEVIQEIIPKATSENNLDIDWLQPYYADKRGNLKAQVQSFVVEAEGKRIMIDTCVGNGRKRPGWPAWNNLQTNFLENLQTAGYKPEQMDMVICTHLHYDHVGWNTIRAGDKWLPTFPNARYLIVGDEYNYWVTKPKDEMQDDLNGIDDSVMPVVEADLVDFVTSDHQAIRGVSLIPTPGHSPHHVSVLIQSEGQSAVITGDVLHHPCQIAHPEWMSYDTNETQALASRLEFLERFANTKTLVIGTHFSSPSAGKIVKKAGIFEFMV
jgi:glyoxylase-like metal-dependent hydrolase (beta-lactamase superfamily II)